MPQNAIGIIGGLGPYAGLDLIRKLHDSVDSRSDQDFPDVYMVSVPRLIPDRSRYIANPDTENPAVGIMYCIEQLAKVGATHIGIPCNTAHAGIIMNQVRCFLAIHNLPMNLLSIIDEAYAFAKEHIGQGKLGLMATQGTFNSQVYTKRFEEEGYFNLLIPNDEEREMISQAIYSRDFGIKAFSTPVKPEALELLTKVGNSLKERGADALILGCTEIPLALQQKDWSIPLLDSSLILARALVKAVLPQKLKPLSRMHKP